MPREDDDALGASDATPVFGGAEGKASFWRLLGGLGPGRGRFREVMVLCANSIHEHSTVRQ